jgi:hypothetical protein
MPTTERAYDLRKTAPAIVATSSEALPSERSKLFWLSRRRSFLALASREGSS